MTRIVTALIAASFIAMPLGAGAAAAPSPVAATHQQAAMAQHRAVHRRPLRRGCRRAERTEPLLLGRRRGRRLEEHRLRPELDEHHRRQDSRHRRSDRRACGRAVESERHLRRYRRGRHSRRLRYRRRRLQDDRRRQDVVVRRIARDAHDREARRSIRAIPTSSTPLRWDTSSSPTPSAASSRRPTAARRGTRCSSSTTTPAASISSMDPRNPQRALRRDVAGAARSRGSSPAAARAADSTRRPTAARTGRRFRRIPGFATGILGKIGVAVAASNPRIVYAIVQARDGGVFRSNDARRDVEARQRRDEAAPARVLLYGDLRRSHEPRGRLRAQSATASTRRPTAARRFASSSRRTATITSSGSIRTIRRSCSTATTAARPFRSTAARRGAASTISPPDSSITSRSTISFRSTSSARQQDEGAFEGRARRSGRASAGGEWHPVALRREHVRRARARRSVRHVRQRLL